MAMALPISTGVPGLNLKDVYFAFYNYFWPTEGGTANHDRVD